MSLALLSFGHSEIFLLLTWLSARNKNLSSLLGRSGADCLDPRSLPWLWSQHQTRSFCAVCSRVDNAEGRAGESPAAQGAGTRRAGLRSGTGGIRFAFKKDEVESPASEGSEEKSLAGVGISPRHLSKRQCCVLQSRQCFLKGRVTGGNSPKPLLHPGDENHNKLVLLCIRDEIECCAV